MAPWLFAAAYAAFDRLQHIWADMAYRGQQLRAWIMEQCGWHLEIVERPRRWGWYPLGVEPPPLPAFTVLPRRWVVERTIAWIGRYRRLSKDYEYLPASSEAMIYLFKARIAVSVFSALESPRAPDVSGFGNSTGCCAMRA
jgi:putative transposase